MEKCALVAVSWGSAEREESARFLCRVLEKETNENVRWGGSEILVGFYEEGEWPFVRECIGEAYRTATSPFLRDRLRFSAANVGVRVPGLPPRYMTQEPDDQRETGDR